MPDIIKEIRKTVDAFGWNIDLLNGFWVRISGEDFNGELISFKDSPLFASSVTLPSMGIEYEEVSIGVNRFKSFVPKNRIKGDLVMTITGGNMSYLANLQALFNATDYTKLHDITVWLYSSNFSNVKHITYKNCLLKSIGDVSMEQSNSMNFFKCNYTFSVGCIDADPSGSSDNSNVDNSDVDGSIAMDENSNRPVFA